MKAWRRSEKKASDRGSGTARNSPGRHSVVPKTISAVERPIPSLGGGPEPQEHPGKVLVPDNGHKVYWMKMLNHSVGLGW